MFSKALSYSIRVAFVLSKNTKSSKVTAYRRPLNPNVGVIIFIVILVYMGISIVRYATAKHIVGYEVRTGSLSSSNIYQGIALRSEEIMKSEYAGHINYYSQEGTRLATGKLAYTIDETGEIAEQLNSGEANDELFTKDDYAKMQSEIASFTAKFRPGSFRQVYDFKNALSSELVKVTNNSILSDIQKISSSSSVHFCNTNTTGDIYYYTDGYEDKTFDKLKLADFDSSAYTKNILKSNSLVAKGDPACKIETNEDWSVAIRLPDEKTAKDLEDRKVVKVRFLKNQDESWATITTRGDNKNGWYANLAFTNSMITFAGDRFIDIELLTTASSGLKIPKSALVDGKFFVIPARFVTKGTGDKQGVLRSTVNDDGEKTTEFVSVSLYGQDEKGEDVYVDQSALRSGDVLQMTDSSETFTIGETKDLTGVYNINKGYADFRTVTKIEENDAYAIVKPDDLYGLREYDFIVLNAKDVNPNEFVYSR